MDPNRQVEAPGGKPGPGTRGWPRALALRARGLSARINAAVANHAQPSARNGFPSRRKKKYQRPASQIGALSGSIARISCPVIAFYGEQDQRVNAGIPGFEEGMRTGGQSFERHIYPGAAHAFFNDDGPTYDVRAARDSFARLMTFFLKYLSG